MRFKLTIFIALFTFTCLASTFAGNVNDLTEHKKNAIQGINKYQHAIDNIKKQHQNNAVKITSPAIIFVSFSMPDLSLKQIIQDAALYRIPVVIRGLHHNAFKDTVEKIYSLVKENNQGGISIHPQWFKEYSITAVPAVIVTDGNKYEVIYGNIRLKNALSIIADRGELSQQAKNILSRGTV